MVYDHQYLYQTDRQHFGTREKHELEHGLAMQKNACFAILKGFYSALKQVARTYISTLFAIAY